MAIVLEAQLRKITGKKCRSLRSQSIIPGQVYNLNHNTNVQFNEKQLQEVLKQAGTTSLIEVKVDDKVYQVLAKEVQYSQNQQRITCVDFYEVDMNKKVITTIPIKIIGTNDLIEKEGAVLVMGSKSIDIEVLPVDIPSFIEVDVSSIATFSDSIKSGMIELQEGASLISNPDSVIATCAETRLTRQQAQEESGESSDPSEEGGSGESSSPSE